MSECISARFRVSVLMVRSAFSEIRIASVSQGDRILNEELNSLSRAEEPPKSIMTNLNLGLIFPP
jgi:hypothetical protein